MTRPLVHIIDGSGYIFRAYYAIRSLSTAQGVPTNAIYGFTTMIEKALRQERPTHLAIVFDAGGENFRHAIYRDYKANRPPPPEDLPPQIPRIRDIARAFRIRELVLDDVEADDVIATLVDLARDAGYDVRLITGDKDLMQLVTEGVSLYEPMRGQRFGPSEVEAKMGVPPAKLADALALAGDATDNVPGVRGVGPKKAAKLLADHRDLEGVLRAAAAGEIKGKLGQTIAESVDQARVSRRLVELRHDLALPLPGGIGDLAYPGPDKDALRKLYVELEFRRLVPKLDDGMEALPEVPSARPAPPPSVALSTDAYVVVRDAEGLRAWVERGLRAERVALAVEVSSDKAADGVLFGMALAVAPGQAAYVPFGPAHGGEGLAEAEGLSIMKPLLEDADVPKVSAESKVVFGAMLERGVQLRGLAFDTTLASYLLVPDDTQHGAAAVAKRYLNHDPIERAPLLRDAKRKRRTFEQVPIERAAPHVSERADVAWVAAPSMEASLHEAEVEGVLHDLELPLIPVLARMERAGIRIDEARLAAMAERCASELARLEDACYAAAGQEFNLGSPKQLQKVLFEDLRLKIVKRTKTGPSTDHSVLEALSEAHPLPSKILEHRQLEKLRSTYVDALPKMVSPKTGRVHTVFGQATAATGRLSSRDPNLQNIPIRTEIGRELRKVFVAEPRKKLISVDYSQIELRVLAHFSREEVLIAAFREGADVHTRTASVLFEVPPGEVTRAQRTQAKAVNFGVLYGMGPVRLARELKIPRSVASRFVQDYFARQPGVKRFIDDVLDEARKTGLVRTLLGRRRLVPELGSRNGGVRAAAERIAVNTPIQGSAADLVKLAMLRVDGILQERFPNARLLLQVHDELLLEAPEDEAAGVAEMVQREMERIYPLEVPLIAAAHLGRNWDDAH